MGFWSKFGKALKPLARIAAEAVAETAASGKPITLGNIGKSAAGAAGKELGKGGDAK